MKSLLKNFPYFYCFSSQIFASSHNPVFPVNSFCNPSDTPVFKPKKSYPTPLSTAVLLPVPQLHCLPFLSPKLHSKQSCFSPTISRGLSVWCWEGGLILSSRFKSGHLSGHEDNPLELSSSLSLPSSLLASSCTWGAAKDVMVVAFSSCRIGAAGSLSGRWVAGSIPRFRSFLLMCVFQ